MNKNKKIYAFFVGGETAGPVMPLLAVAQAWKEEQQNLEPVFLDIKKSVASRVVPLHGFQFRTMTSGKIRRYWSFKNLLSPFLIVFGIIRSLLLIAKFRPKIIVSAGGYVQVPVDIAAFFMGVPRVIHQQDLVPTFSNRLVAPIATAITTTFEKSTKDFSQGSGFEKNFGSTTKITCTGNPCAITPEQRKITAEKKAEAQKLFKLDPDWPTVLVIGGGSGAMGLNQVLHHNLPDLLKVAQVLHSAGRGKMIETHLESPKLHDNYHQFEFIDRMDLAYAAADVVIARAGIGTITELSAMGKISIIVPMPNSHQEWNAKYLYDIDAAIVFDQYDITPDLLAKSVRKILFNIDLQKTLQKNMASIMPADATQRMLKIVKEVAKK